VEPLRVRIVEAADLLSQDVEHGRLQVQVRRTEPEGRQGLPLPDRLLLRQLLFEFIDKLFLESGPVEEVRSHREEEGDVAEARKAPLVSALPGEERLDVLPLTGVPVAGPEEVRGGLRSRPLLRRQSGARKGR